MKRQRVIIIEKEDSDPEVWGSLTEACRNHKEFVYDYVKKLKYPFKYKGMSFRRVYYRTKNIL